MSSRSWRRLAAVGAATALATVGIQIVGTGIASAHTNTVSGVSSCEKDGTYTVTWTVISSNTTVDETATTDHTPSGASLDPTTFTIPTPGQQTLTESGIDGSSTSASLTVHGVWTDGTKNDASNTVTLDGKCNQPPPTVSPVSPTVDQAKCYGGKPTAPTLTLPTTAGIDYSASPAGPYAAGDTVTVTATATGGNTFDKSPPSGWTYVDSTHETYTVTFDKVSCGGNPTPVAPKVTQSQCDGGVPTAPTLTLPTTAGITYSASPKAPYTQGQTVTVTATADGGNTFTKPAPSGWTYVDSTHETYTVTFDKVSCNSNPTPKAPTVTQAQCNGTTPSAPTLTLASTDGITYTVAPSAPYTAGQTVTVTATANGGNTFTKPAPSGWTYVDSTHETYTVVFDDVQCGSTVKPASPSFSDDTCTGGAPTGATYTIPTTTGVDYSVNGVKTPAGTYPAADGSSITVTATPQAGYVLTGTTTFTHTFPATPTCSKTVTPTSPGFSDDQCVNNTPAGATYTIPSTTGVDYYVNGTKVPAGTYPATDGSSVTVTAKPQTGYTLTGTSTFTHTFPATPTCGKSTTPVSPGFADDQCVSGTPAGATYTIPATTGVDYYVNGTKVPAGTYPGTDGSSVTVTAKPQTGYTLTGTSTFTHTFTAAPACAESVVAAAASFTDDVCVSDQLTGASYTIPDSTGVVYTIDGSPVAAGTYPATDGSTVTIEASPEDGFTLTGLTQWTHSFPAKPTDCSGTAGENGDRGNTGTGSGNGTSPLSSSNGAGGVASTGVPVEQILLSGIVLLLLGAACFVAATARRRGQPTT